MDGKLRKISPLALSIAMLTATAALAGDEKFDTIAPGTLPADWICGVTGKGSPVWKVEADASAPSKPNVLRQSGTGTFPWCVKQSAQITDGFVEVKVQAARRPGGSGRRPRVAVQGRQQLLHCSRQRARKQCIALSHAEWPSHHHQVRRCSGAAKQWHTLRVEFAGKAIKVMLDGKQYITAENDQIAGAGAVGVWTKADSVTAFDDFSYGGQ